MRTSSSSSLPIVGSRFSPPRFAAHPVLPLILALVAISAKASPASADACSSQSQQRCYDVAIWDPADQNSRIDAIMNVECLYESSPSNNFVDEQIWEGTDNDSSGTYWVETGMSEGAPWGSGRVFFWADNRPTYGYAQHPVNGMAANLNTNYSLQINWYSNSSTWQVWIGGTYVGQSTSNPPYSKYVVGGSEFTNVGVRAAANFWGLDWYGPGGTKYNNWGGEGVVIGAGSVSVPTAPYWSFSNLYDGIGSCSPSSPAQTSSSAASPEVVNPVPSSKIDSATQSALLQVTKSTAAWLGDAAPAKITVVPTTRYAANQLTFGSTINNAVGKPDTTGVYLVQAIGSFVAPRGAPGGATSPKGSALTLVIDPATNAILDWGISPQPVTQGALSTLGDTTVIEPTNP